MITEQQKQAIKDEVLSLYIIGCDLPALAKQVEHNFIFGPEAKNLHFNIDDIYSIVLEVEAEQNPPQPVVV